MRAKRHWWLGSMTNFDGIPAARQSRPRLTTVELGEGQLDIPRNIPTDDRTLLSAVVTLVVNDRFYSGMAPVMV